MMQKLQRWLQPSLIFVVLRGQLDAGGVVLAGQARRRQQVHERVVPGRQRGMHRLHHAGVVLRAADRQHVRVRMADQFGALAQAAGDDDLAVRRQRLADRVERFGHRRIDEAAGIDHHHVGVVVGRHQVVAFHPQLGEDALGIDQGLRAAEADEADPGIAHGLHCHGEGGATAGPRRRRLRGRAVYPPHRPCPGPGWPA
jgi:hypothetical protein